VNPAKDLVFHRALLSASERYADQPATIDTGFTATYGEHIDRVLRLGHAMRHQLGIVGRDRFAVMALNGHHFLELWHSGFLGAGIVNPLNLRLAATELQFILHDSGTKVIFVDAAFAPLVDRVRAEAGIEQVVLIGSGDVPHDATIEEVIASGEAIVPPEPEEDDPAILMYTGGTTGIPKGVLIDHRAAVLNLYKIGAEYAFSEQYVYLHQTPMFHAASLGGVLAIPAAGGASTFVALFDPTGVMEVIERTGVTVTVMVPTMVQMLLDHPDFRPERLRSLKVLTYGASPMPAVLLRRLIEALPWLDVYQGYGMTENCGLLTILGPTEHRRGGELLASAGRPVIGNAVSIRDPHGEVVAPGEVGEVWARGGNLMREYWERPEQTEAAFAGGWYHTGDAGRLDEHGYLYLVDRVKDMIVTGGENVYSAEVEDVLTAHPAVAQAAVIGVPSELWGEAVHAVVVLRSPGLVTAEELQHWMRERIAAYKIPKSIEFRLESLPLSGAMKVLKRELREPYWQGASRQ
jgi:long-chain acyl-CoA synthetase